MLHMLILAALLQTPNKNLDRLCRELHTSKQVSERIKAAKQIGEYGASAKGAPATCALVGRQDASGAAGRIGSSTVDPKFREAVLPIVVDGNIEYRTEMIDALRQERLPFKARDAIPAVAFRFTVSPGPGPLFDAPKLEKQGVACLKTLVHVGPDDKDVIALTLLAAGKSEFPVIRGVALELVPSLKPEDPAKVVAVLVNAVKSDRSENQVSTINGLAKLKTRSKDALETLRKAKGNSNTAVREAATTALKKLEP